MAGRRSSDDPKWAETKKIVDKRDRRQCQFEKCLSLKESYQLKIDGPTVLDRAHIFAASARPDQIYNPKNVITLRRFIHQRMDGYKNPITGDPIDYNETMFWWHRILKKFVDDYEPDVDYEELLKAEIR